MTSVTEEMIEALKPCPFCGGEAISGESQEICFAGCADPDCIGYRQAFDFVDEAHAAAAWNTRILEAALSASPASQTGDWVLVPREPTEAMLEAAFGLFDRVGVTTKVPAALGFEAWHAMLAAAPSAPQPTEPVAWRCDGCGRLAKDPDADLKGPRDAGHISCCPEREMLPLYLAFPVAQQREDGWFDMSIAPKNGTRIVVQMPDGPGEEYWYETPAGWRYAVLSPERKDQSNG